MFVFEFICSDPPRRAALSQEGSTKCACLREGDAPRAGLERREDLVLASKLRQEVRAARGREKGRVPRTVVAVLVPLPVSAAEPARGRGDVGREPLGVEERVGPVQKAFVEDGPDVVL